MQPIVKMPIHDPEGRLWAYEVLYSKNGRWASKSTDEDAASALEALISHCSSKDFIKNRVTFATFTHNLFARNVPSIFAPSALVLQVDQNELLYEPDLAGLESYHNQGYKIALVGFEFNSRCLAAMNMADYIKLSFRDVEIAAGHESVIKIAEKLSKTVIAYNVNTKESYELAKSMGIEYMQGTYIASAMPERPRRMDHLRNNFLELMSAVFNEEMDVNEVETIISRDVTLTYSLMKMVNSAFFSLRSRVQSVHHALIILGVAQLRQWIYLLSFKNDGDVPEDFIKLSLIRAYFCEALHNDIPEMPISRSEAYLMGMFSTLEALVQRPLEEILQELSCADEIIDALIKGEGKCGLLYKLITCYEQGDWHGLSEYADELNIPAEVISQRYIKCSDAVDELWERLAKKD